jgi:hypothetical protein
MSYDAFKHRSDDLARNAARVLDLVRNPPANLITGK